MIIIKSKFGILQFILSLFVLGHFFLLGVGIGLDMKWVEVSRISGPTITPQNPAVWLPGRRGGFWCPRGLSSWLVKSGPPWVPRPFRLPKARFWRFGTRGVPSLILLWRGVDRFDMRGAHSLVLLWSSADLAVGGFLGNWAGFMTLVILPLSFVRIKFSLDCVFYIRHPGRTILLHSQTPKFCRNSKSLFFFSSWTKNAAWILDIAAKAKEAETKDFPTFQPSKKENSPPSTRDRSRRKLHQALDEPPNANQECVGVG